MLQEYDAYLPSAPDSQTADSVAIKTISTRPLTGYHVKIFVSAALNDANSARFVAEDRQNGRGCALASRKDVSIERLCGPSPPDMAYIRQRSSRCRAGSY